MIYWVIGMAILLPLVVYWVIRNSERTQQKRRLAAIQARLQEIEEEKSKVTKRAA